MNRQADILWRGPTKANTAQDPPSTGYLPTYIEAAMHTMTLNPPDANWYIDTGATSYMTSSQDIRTGIPILRCDSSGDLYTFVSAAPTQASPTALTTISPASWHSRLGHPGAPVLASLRNKKIISYTKTDCHSKCRSCVLGKFVKLPFYDSRTTTLLLFDIIHSDLWTSPVLSSIGHKYYVLFLDDFSN